MCSTGMNTANTRICTDPKGEGRGKKTKDAEERASARIKSNVRVVWKGKGKGRGGWCEVAESGLALSDVV